MSLKFLRSTSSVIECQVVLLDNSQFIATFDQKTVLGSDLFDKVCEKAQVPPYYRQYFGLQYIDREDGDVDWLHMDKEIHPRRKSKPLLYQFAVKVFPRDPIKLEKDMQKLILLQVKTLINRGKFSLPVNEHALIDGFYAQAMLGDFNSKRHKPGYLEDLLGLFYCPPTGINSDGNISEEDYEVMVKDLHKSHRGMTREEAVSAALDICKELENYGAWMHYGGIDSNGNEVVFCVSIDGIRVCQLKSRFPEAGAVCHNFHWRDIISMFCDNAKFYMYVAEARDEESMTSRVYRFNKGLYGYKAARRLLVDAENHQKFFFEDNPERATIMRSLSVEAKSMNRVRTGLAAKINLSVRRATIK
ncbi:hypothetical protein ACROYT_G005620 [Oculina patagonica]